ncbi:MAG: hypothetical protein ACFFFT_00305 [Candidatus Thorarchaeota archaeon]
MGINIVRVRSTYIGVKRFIKCKKFYSVGYLTGLPTLFIYCELGAYLAHNSSEYLNQYYEEIG